MLPHYRNFEPVRPGRWQVSSPTLGTLLPDVRIVPEMTQRQRSHGRFLPTYATLVGRSTLALSVTLHVEIRGLVHG